MSNHVKSCFVDKTLKGQAGVMTPFAGLIKLER